MARFVSHPLLVHPEPLVKRTITFTRTLAPTLLLAVTTTSVSTNGEFQTAIDNCASTTTCEIEVTANMVITSTLNMEGKNLIIKSAKADGSNAELDGQGSTQLAQMNHASTVSITGIDFKNGYMVSMTSAMP